MVRNSFIWSAHAHSIPVSNLYPPKNKSGLLDFVKLIESKARKQLHQACLLYYLFLDYPESLTPNDNLAQYYADEIDMPEGFRHLVDGFHALDKSQLKQGLLHLSHPTVTPTYPERIIDTFLHANIRQTNNNRLNAASSPTTENYSIAVAYITAKSPALVSSKSIDVYISALCSVSVYAALSFTRAVSDISEPNQQSVKSTLLRALVNSCLTSSASSHLSSSSYTPPSTTLKRPRKNPLHNLSQSSLSAWRFANLPLTPAESQTVEAILNDIITGSAHAEADSTSSILERRKAALAKDVLLMAMHRGDFEGASKVAATNNFKLASNVPPKDTSGAPRPGEQQDQQRQVEWTDISRGLSLGLNA